MTKRHVGMTGSQRLTAGEATAVLEAIGFRLAGEIGREADEGAREALERAQTKLVDALERIGVRP